MNNKNRKYRVIFIGLFTTSLLSSLPSSAINVTCENILVSEIPDPFQFNLAYQLTVNPETLNSGAYIIPKGLMDIVALNKIGNEKLQLEMDHFYQVYRKNSRFLEEYKTQEEHQKNPWITRFDPHYLWLTSQFMIAKNGKISTETILNEMAYTNKIILESLNITDLTRTSIAKISESEKGSIELRAAVYTELKLQNKELSREAIVDLYKDLSNLKIKSLEWTFLNHVIFNSNNPIQFQEAHKLYLKIQSLIKNNSTLSAHEIQIFDLMNNQNLSANKALDLLNRFNTDLVTLPHLLTMLQISPAWMTSESLGHILKEGQKHLNHLNTTFNHELYSERSELLSIIYLAFLPKQIPTSKDLESVAENNLNWQNSVETYNSVFINNQGPGWLKEELFIKYLIKNRLK